MFLRRICVLRRGATAYWRQGYAKRVLVVAEGVAAVELRGNDSPARVYAFTAEVGGLTGDGRFEGFLSTLSGAGGAFYHGMWGLWKWSKEQVEELDTGYLRARGADVRAVDRHTTRHQP
jgi:hypothetical protein